MNRKSQGPVATALVALALILVSACDTQAQFAPSMPRVVGLQSAGEQLRVLAGAPCSDVDEIVVVFSGDGEVESRRTQLAAREPSTFEQMTIGAEIEVAGFETIESLPADFDWRDYSEMDVGFSGPAGLIGGATSDLEPIKAEGVERAGDGTAYIRGEGWLTPQDIADGDTESFLGPCTPDPAKEK